ncbi:transcriptional regulator, AlpA family [Georgenia satyanarayanai]|uniref:Transcriptional regulator, AlpA family n=1 Tax=Georgenia satyanarayanai TaxID=860221 RepID=A0A2Y9ACY6_9MICO|nr:helix-turn-helix domain-containing protein [Georgenia satyanarayanai]PYG00196.1 AlpA family transcriptional regulator [Georgenia satyanarayanai]SSA40439.1 transcriptional regulator, AlpA family [Georgenia satyanarayanai]
MATNDDVLLSGEVALLLRVPKSWVEQAAREGRIPSWKAGRYRRFSRADIEQWKKQQTGGDRLATDRRRRGRRPA